MAFLVGHLS